ncbi:TonB dependent receptor [Tsuneonella dongtanensis]|uniref:TonB dependent receptor n=1 Tax=Tsuneonella dongtanensis TaxID=692370 RepID=A0A1B2ADJ1_9SPHN|nr:TonB-dependent receptor [Tsuneonella dongtanensis]ANY20219.1 TonB dependent receptor [Tsuneonella dongtanensis]
MIATRHRSPVSAVLRQGFLGGVASLALAMPAVAQDVGTGQAGPATESSDDGIVVSGVRATQRNSLQTKRNADLIVDALVSEEIGATPDQSVGETLERIVGVTADRFKGSASEISIRGLGPFLGFSTLNGREVTSGSGDRAVSFQQFPSELVNGVLVYKSQNASLVEGGTSGVIDLRTLRPLDYGKARVTIDARGVYEPHDARIEGRNGLGYRISASVIDQFQVGDGELGISIGYARADESAAEDFYTESSSVRPCNSIGTNTSGNCSYSAASANPVYFVPNAFLYRQMNNDLTRDAVMGTIQFKPRPELDINIDGQFSRRSWTENRVDFSLAEGRRGIIPLSGGLLADGTLLAFQGNSYLEAQPRNRERDEDYYGGGFSAEWTDDAAKIGLDLSYSETQRDQVDRSTRLRSTGTRMFAVTNPNGTTSNVNYTSGRVPYILDKSSGYPVLSIFPLANGSAFDLDDASIYLGNGRAQRQAEYRTDKIFAARLDGTAFVADSFITAIKGGLRYSNHLRLTDLDNDNDIDPVSATVTAAGNAACAIPFREKNYFGGTPINVSSFASFDPLCLYEALAGTPDAGPLADPRSISDLNVREQIMAAYAMADFGNPSGTFGGNIGVRVVNTQVTSKGFRGSFNATTNTAGVVTLAPVAGAFENVTGKNNFWSVLPSVNARLDLSDDFLVRGAIYKAISRPNIEDMGAGRFISTDSAGNPTTILDAISGISGGNPRLEPLESWNADVSFEWYPSADNAITLAGFYKRLRAGIVPATGGAIIEPFTINGQTILYPVAQQTNSDDTSKLWGFEATLNHSFSYLPGLLGGFGVILGYSYADTDFEYPDPSIVDGVNPLANFVAPATFVGLSKHTLSAEGYYEKGPLALRLIYKYRSPYFKPFQLAANRYSSEQKSLDASASIDLTKNVELRFQALNLTNEDYILSRPTLDSVSEVSSSGRRYYAGVKLRF